MIQSKILGSAVGIQYQGVQDLSETSPSSTLTNATVVGRFKRGFTGKPFTVTRDNFQAILGYDPTNPDYLAVEDAFRLGISELQIMRVGATLGKW